MEHANETGDAKKFDALFQIIYELGKKLGPEYTALIDGLQDIDPQSEVGQEISSTLDALDNLCGGNGHNARNLACTTACLKMTETTFTLVRTIKSRGGGDDDYDVYNGDKVIGRIVRHPQAPMEAPWFWAITTEGLSRSWLADRGYAVSREHALAQFRARWISTTLFAIAWLTFRPHRWPRSSFVAFSAAPKFGSP